jgi:AraC-like DNA-binding protein
MLDTIGVHAALQRQALRMDYSENIYLKKFGICDFNRQNPANQLIDSLRDFIKVVFLRAGGRVSVDFTELEIIQDGLLFVNAGQFLWLSDHTEGSILYYNEELYGVQLHEQAMACDKILFSDFHKVSFLKLNQENSGIIYRLFEQIRDEISQHDLNLEEMVRVLLKQVIIKAARFYNHQAQLTQLSEDTASCFATLFVQLVERHYLKHHDVASYANMLNISAKALYKRVGKYSKSPPNEIIKRRIILEAKRLLVYTQLSVKEVSHKLGYEDPYYFTRFFSRQVKIPPQTFRMKVQNILPAVA